MNYQKQKNGSQVGSETLNSDSEQGLETLKKRRKKKLPVFVS